MKKIYTLGLMMLVVVAASGQWAQIEDPLTGPIDDSQFGIDIDMNSTGDRILIGAPYADPRLAYFYENIDGVWTLLASLDGDSPDASPQLGNNVSMSSDGTVLAVTEKHATDIKDVHLYHWEDVGDGVFDTVHIGTIFLSNKVADASIGFESTSLSDDGLYLAFGATGYDMTVSGDDNGIVRVYNYDLTSWTQIGSDLVGAQDDNFGASLSFNADASILAVGASRYSLSKGKVSIYELSGGEWVKKGSDLVGENSSDFFGNNVALNATGDICVVGALNYNEGTVLKMGAVYVYKYDGSDWVLMGSRITRTNPVADEKFGSAVSTNDEGSVVAIGAEGYAGEDGLSTNLGLVEVFSHTGGEWVLKEGAGIVGPAAGSKFGHRVDLDKTGDRVAIAAPETTKGSVYFYVSQSMVPVYNVVFEDYDGTAIGDIQEVKLDSLATPPVDPTRDAYDFIGWAGKGETEVTTDFTITSDTTFVAQYDATTYTITYMLYGGTNATANPSTYTIETATITLEDPTKEGYSFLGWYSTETYDGGTELTEITTGSTGDTTLYARFEINVYDVTFEDYDGSSIGDLLRVEHGSAATPPADISRDGYDFIGWAGKGETEVTTDFTITSDTTFVAQYVVGIWDQTMFERAPYPNPTTGKFYLNMKQKGKVDISLYNITGSLVSTMSFSDKEIELDIEAAPGVYFLEIRTGNKTGLIKLLRE